jgi:hypothetical protein
MKKIKLSNFKDFLEVKHIKEGEIKTEDDVWSKYFTDVEQSKKEAEAKPGSGGNLPDWAKKGMEMDLLKGKSADQRWDWLTQRINTVLKGKQVSKVEDIKESVVGGMPGYRLLWKEDKTETGNQQDKSGKVYKTYYTDMFKGNPGTWLDRKDEGGKPGAELGKGYWGQNSRVAKPTTPTSAGATGATGADGIAGGILWIDDPGKSSSSGATGGFGDVKLIDLFAQTEIGEAVLKMFMDKDGNPSPEMAKYLKSKGIQGTDSPATSEDIDRSFTPEQKAAQEKNIKKLNAMGNKTEKPDYALVTSPTDYVYSPDSLKMSWDTIKKGLDNSGASSKMNFDQWNLVGIRNSLPVKNKYSNRFTDLIALIGPEKSKQVKVYPATTTPGVAMMFNPFRRWWLSSALSDTVNFSGLAILQPGVYDYSVGNHKGKYEALVQSGSASVGRIDPVEEASKLKFETYSPSKKENGTSGINIHKAGADTRSVDSWSAGCQVLKKSGDFNDLMQTVKSSGQNKFKYALINSSDLAKKGSPLA